MSFFGEVDSPGALQEMEHRKNTYQVNLLANGSRIRIDLFPSLFLGISGKR